MEEEKVELFVERLGVKGPHVIILHGWGCSIEQMRPLGELLSHKMQVHLIDLPGFGRSTTPEETWSSFDYAQRLVRYLKEKNILSAHLVGHSFGGKVAMSMAKDYPVTVSTLTLLASSGLKRSRSLKDKVRMKAIVLAGTLFKAIDNTCGSSLFETKIAQRYGSPDYRNAGPMRPILVKSVNEDLSETAKAIKQPTLLLWGENDVDTPPTMGRRFHELISGSTLYVFPGKNHHLYQEGGSSLCASYILPFIANQEAINGKNI